MLLALAGCVIAAPSAQSLERSGVVRPVAKECGAGETLFKAIKTTRFEGGIRVDYQLVETGDTRWANMNSPLLRKFRIKVGARFCMPLDNGGPADSPFDYD